MASPKPNRLNETLRATKMAMTMATEARIVVHGYGTLFEALLNILQTNGVLDQSKVQGVFFVAAAMIDAQSPETEIQLTTQAEIRAMISRIAANNGIELPPPGQTGVLTQQ